MVGGKFEKGEDPFSAESATESARAQTVRGLQKVVCHDEGTRHRLQDFMVSNNVVYKQVFGLLKVSTSF